MTIWAGAGDGAGAGAKIRGKVSFRISSVVSMLEPEPGAGSPSHRLRPKSTGSATQHVTTYLKMFEYRPNWGLDSNPN